MKSKHVIERSQEKGKPKILVKAPPQKQKIKDIAARSKKIKNLTQEDKMNLILEQQETIIDLLTEIISQ